MKRKIIDKIQLLPIIVISIILIIAINNHFTLNDKKLITLIIIPLLIISHFFNHAIYVIGALIFLILGLFNFFEYTGVVVLKSIGFPNMGLKVTFHTSFILPLIAYLILTFKSIKTVLIRIRKYLKKEVDDTQEIQFFERKFDSYSTEKLHDIIESESTTDIAKIAAEQVLDNRNSKTL